jgi:hypothetical protein
VGMAETSARLSSFPLRFSIEKEWII